MKEQVFSFPMVGGNFLGIVRGLGNERLFVTNLALYVVDLWNEKNMGVFQLQLNISPRCSKCTASNYIPYERPIHKLSNEV